jgi:iron complex transport system substrate-binding protein
MIFTGKHNETVFHVKVLRRQAKRLFPVIARLVRVIVVLVFVIVHIQSCSKSPEQATNGSPSLNIEYATGFTVRKEGNVTWVNVTHPYNNATSGYTYLLVPKGETVPEHPADVQVITIPLESIVCTSTTHIPHLDYLGVSDKLVGFPSTDYVSSETTRKRIDSGLVKELGVDKGMNLELLYQLKPSMVMAYTMTADLGQLKKIQEMGIPVVINGEYMERDPLARAEWIKFTSLFFGKEKIADSIFSEIDMEYSKIQTMAESADKKPSVLCGTVYGDAWFMPGGENYAARLLRDATTNYLWARDSTQGWLEISFESVYDKAKDADLWIVGSFDTFDELKAADERYGLFKPFKTNQVYNYNARKGAKGGNDFLELGYMRPDIILKDLVKIAHPELLPDYELYFHSKLK